MEFYPINQIRSRYGERGVTDYDRDGDRPGEFTDDTQMCLFTLEGLVRGHVAVRHGLATTPLPAVQFSYQRWLHTQGYTWQRAAGPFAADHPEPDGWLVGQHELFSVRSPGSGGITALRDFASGAAPGTFVNSINDSDSCGGVVRAVGAALWSEDPKQVFELASATAALTYSKPDGYLPAGVLAVLVHRLLRGSPLRNSVDEARSLLVGYAGHEGTDRALGEAVELASRGEPTPEQLKDALGGGWAGHEALAIAVCAALSTKNMSAAVMLAVNHSGDSDSTGALCGNIVGALYGSSALPGVWLRDLRQRETIETLAAEALLEFGAQPPNHGQWSLRYPPTPEHASLSFVSTLPTVEAAERGEPEAPETSEETENPGEAEPTNAAEIAGPDPGGQRAAERRNHADWSQAVLGCLLGGSVGDALGYAVEFDSLEVIREKYGRAGLTDFVDAHRPGGSISDDTQMTLFTLEGLIRASIRRRLFGETEPGTQVQYAYQRWLHTQGFEWRDAGGPIADTRPDGWLIQQKGLFVRRAPGSTCVQALHGYASGRKPGSFTHRLNESKGCGGVMRAAPVGLWSEDPAEVFRVGAVTGVLTHGHPSGFLPAGALAVIIGELLVGHSLTDAVESALRELSVWDDNEETTAGIRRARNLAAEGEPSAEKIQQELGGGWVGEEALAIAVYAATVRPDSFSEAVTLAANHSGDSDSTAALCGNIMGALLSVEAIPEQWRSKLELREVIEQLATDACREFGPQPPEEPEWLERYPVGAVVELSTGNDIAPRDSAELVAPEEPVPTTPETSAREPVTSTTPEPSTEAVDDENDSASATEVEQADSEPAEHPGASPTTADEQDRHRSAPRDSLRSPAPVNSEPNLTELADPVPAAVASVQEAIETERTEDAESDDAADPLSEEELRLLAAWRKFRDGDEGTPVELSQGLYTLLVEAFGERRAAQIVGDNTETRERNLLPAQTPVELDLDERLAGCVLGGAVGDALGAPWMFTDLADIRKNHPEGLRELGTAFGRRGAATAVTQQTAFLLEGFIRANIRGIMRGISAHLPGMVRYTLESWLNAQGTTFEPTLFTSALDRFSILRAQRFPDEATLTALARWRGHNAVPTPAAPPNASTNATATARGAVVGFHTRECAQAVALGAEVAVVTHGGPDGYLPAGALAGLVSTLSQGRTLVDGVNEVLAELDKFEGCEATALGLRSAVKLAEQGPVPSESLEELGSGWQAPEALAIALAAALSHPDSYVDAVSLAASHSGNSPATAAICGSLLGAVRGSGDIPSEWSRALELREVLDELLADQQRIGAEIHSEQPVPGWAKPYVT